ncbi:cupin domain-containing protein [Novosphingobium sp.]|uniref:cupin domain-containing protein n=1 Tax=Novosphingobium sp. TaxID=1874826 RepID=UPI00260F6D26|nr:cupin domain-containing protein [Novosphingobium sp.]
MNRPLLAVSALLWCSHAAAEPVAADPMPPAARAIIDHYHMQNIPHEGPWFLQTFKSDDVIEGALAERYKGKRWAYTAIYAVFTRSDFSAMHRLATDELWHFYGGSPAQILLLYPDGHGETRIWGSNVLKGEEPQIMVPRGTWMGARPIGDPQTAYSFGANTLSPGFEYADYEPGYRDELTALYPKFAAEIAGLTRDESARRPADSTAPKPALVPPVAVEELVGRTAPQRSEAISVARFVLQKGAAIPLTVTREGSEAMVVAAGKGRVTIGSKVQDVAQGSVVLLPPGVPHRIDADTRLEFTVSVAPAWQASDMTILPDPANEKP